VTFGPAAAFESVTGKGVRGTVGARGCLGNRSLMEQERGDRHGRRRVEALRREGKR
jgi:cation transport ATPase